METNPHENKKNSSNALKIVAFVVLVAILCSAGYYVLDTQKKGYEAEINKRKSDLGLSQNTIIEGNSVENADGSPIASVKTAKSEISKYDVSDKYGRYYINPINFDSNTKTIKGVKVEYITISGLKDKSIENKINSEIESKINNLFNKNSKIASFDFTVNSNFSNILDVSFATYNNDGDFIDSDVILVNLETGESPKLTDVFKDTSIIRSNIISGISKFITIGKVEGGGPSSVSDYDKDTFTNIEDEIQQIIHDYDKNIDNITIEDLTPRVLKFKAGNSEISIDLLDANENVVLFNHDSSIYENKPDETMSVLNYLNTQSLSADSPSDVSFYYESGSNYFIQYNYENPNIFSSPEDQTMSSETYKRAVNLYLKNYAKDIKDKAASNPNKFYFSSGCLGGSIYSKDEIVFEGTDYDFNNKTFDINETDKIKEYTNDYLDCFWDSDESVPKVSTNAETDVSDKYYHKYEYSQNNSTFAINAQGNVIKVPDAPSGDVYIPSVGYSSANGMY